MPAIPDLAHSLYAEEGQPRPYHATRGAVRAAALAARQARQVRLKSQQRGLDQNSARQPSPVGGSYGRQAFHEKKHFNLKLSLDNESSPEKPSMLSAEYASPVETPWVAMDDAEHEPVASSGRRPRRHSSVTLSINSPEGADFQEVANDGPAQLGKFTKRVKKLGKGAGGTVYLSMYLPALQLVAVKEVVVYKPEERDLVKHELHALHANLVPLGATNGLVSPPGSPARFFSGVRSHFEQLVKSSTSSTACPYLVAFYGAFLLPAKCAVSIVMEFMDRGSLQDLLDTRTTIPEPILRHCAFCCMTALEHMHRHRMIHRDIKPANILMNHNGDFKIADFGLAGTLLKSESFFSEFEGTMMYMAPERIQGKLYSYVSDLWSMGVSLFYLATGAYPFAVDDGFFGLEEAIVNDPLPPMPNRFSAPCRDFIKSLLRRDPDQRLTAADALAHQFLRDYERSTDFTSFPSHWQQMPLRPAIRSDDTGTIARLLVDYSQRYPQIVQIPTSPPRSPERGSPSSRGKPTFLDHITFMFNNHDDKTNPKTESEMQRLANDCDVSVEALMAHIEQALGTTT
ncbi:hypothetical protein Poli38472_000830 [Pythium oligandrum]|uniref:mitogen-activated protein kinase kinase n=1 Tax=Pythium oligandrum TaxID=41045 RepID=A0A8K1CDW1_PYTOL|nr:hypothetical protein Poli38472_000830 [Pythium oligandrum]|eukprot:TMW60788.1 hypothetical protein Poli38472_000830 [Pythium oligandrum]